MCRSQMAENHQGLHCQEMQLKNNYLKLTNSQEMSKMALQNLLERWGCTFLGFYSFENNSLRRWQLEKT